MNRTFGSEVNVLSSLEVINSIFKDSKGKLVFKAFDRKVDHYPSIHSDFNKIPFWKKGTWILSKTGNASACESFKTSIHCTSSENLIY